MNVLLAALLYAKGWLSSTPNRKTACLFTAAEDVSEKEKEIRGKPAGGCCEWKEVCVGGGCFVDRCVGMWHEKS